MADIELVIKIQEKAYSYIKREWVENDFDSPMNHSMNAIKNGMPLPKGYWTIKQYLVPIKNEQVPTIEHRSLSIEPTACKIVYTYTHSSCKSEEYLNKSNYCPNCGAKMIDPQESEDG